MHKEGQTSSFQCEKPVDLFYNIMKNGKLEMDFFLQDNALAHSLLCVLEFVAINCLDVVPYPLHSMQHLLLFPKLKFVLKDSRSDDIFMKKGTADHISGHQITRLPYMHPTLS
jgi:hypothetical protein